MGGGAGRPDPVEPESVGRGEEHIHEGAGREAERDRPFAPRDLGDAGCLAQPSDQRLARGRLRVHGDEFQCPDDFAAAPHGPGHLDPQCAPVLEAGERAPHRFALVPRVVKQPQAAGPAQGSDATADILRGLGAEARQRRQTAIARRGLEIGQRLDCERVVDLAHLGGAQAGNAEHLRKARRDLLAQLVECARAARGKELRSGGVLHRPDAKRALPFELEKRGELVEGAANGMLVHACPMNLTAQL